MSESDHGAPTAAPHDVVPDPTPAAGGLPAHDEGSERNHYTLSPLPWLAGCSDVGLRHQMNQDALSLAGRDTPEGPVAVIAISDGVSTSPGSEASAAIATEVSSSTLVAMLRRDPALSIDQVEQTMVDAFAAANDAVLSQHTDLAEPGSCTLVTAVLYGDNLTVGNIGDCRTYWVGDGGGDDILSVDDSLAQARIEMGMPREQAEQSFQAHAITRWLGPDSNDVVPRRTTLEGHGPGWLLVCSDGLWNYCSPVEEMAALVRHATSEAGGDPSRSAELLVEWANQQGGRDNVTVALARLDPCPGAITVEGPLDQQAGSPGEDQPTVVLTGLGEARMRVERDEPASDEPPTGTQDGGSPVRGAFTSIEFGGPGVTLGGGRDFVDDLLGHR